MDLFEESSISVSPQSSGPNSRLQGDPFQPTFLYSSPRDVRNILRTPRTKVSVANSEDKKRQRGCSEDFVPVFSQCMYDRIESFLDNEDLYIVSPSPIMQNAWRKPPLKLIRFNTNPEINLTQINEKSDDEKEVEVLAQGLPSILARRTLSAGVTSNVKQTLMTFTKTEHLVNTKNLSLFSKEKISRLEIVCNEDISPLH